jgi:hypothetical protein
LPGSEDAGNYNPPSHDIVNIVQQDLNNDGNPDLILTDNKSDNANGGFTVLINNGNFTFTNATSTYFPSQANNMSFQYYTRTFTYNNQLILFASASDSNYSFSTVPNLWVLSNSTFSAYQSSQMTADVSGYTNPTVYKTGAGNLNLLLIQTGNNGQFTFYTRSL